MTTKTRDQKVEFNMTHEFNSPRELVFNAFGDADALNEWWGPVQSKNTVLSLDFKPGGVFHYKMESQDSVSYGRFLFGKILPHHFLEFDNAFADIHANVVKAPFDIALPLEIHYELTFTETNSKTTIALTGYPVNATEEEVASFRMINPDMKVGFGATFERLAAYLKR